MIPELERRRVVELAERLARDELAPRAARYDAEAANPVDSWRALHREGLLAASVPASYGGLGLDMPAYIGVVRALARGCASTAMTFHMHSTVMRFIDALGTDTQKARYFPEVVRGGKLFGSWGSEPAVSLSRALFFEMAIHADGDQWVIDGVKHFCTMASGASYMIVWCAVDGESDMGKALLIALVPADTPGMTTDRQWNTLGMRGTYSPSVTFTRVRIPGDAVLGRPGAALQIGVIESFALGYAAIYLGISESALAFASDYVKQRVVRPENIPVALDPTIQRHIGELAVQLDATSLVLQDSASRWDAADVADRGHLASRAKYLATQAGLDVTSRAIQIVGGRGSYKDFPLERAFRDVRTATLMPPTVDRMLETIGKTTLGLDEGMFKIRRG